jgi:hypothetical protein
MKKKTDPKPKKVKAPKGLELKLESKSKLKAKAIKAACDNMMIHDNPYTDMTFKQYVSKRKVNKAFQLGRKKK